MIEILNTNTPNYEGRRTPQSIQTGLRLGGTGNEGVRIKAGPAAAKCATYFGTGPYISCRIEGR